MPDQNWDLVNEFRRKPRSEQILAGAALAVFLALLVDNRFPLVFREWFATGALAGSAGVLLFTLFDLIGTEVLEERQKTKVIVLLAFLPVAGFVIDKLRDFWQGVMLAGALVMGYAATKISTRENILPRGLTNRMRP